MSWFRNLRLTVQLGVSFVLMATLVILVGMIGSRSLQKVQATGDRIRTHAVVPLGELNTINGRYQRWRLNLAKLPEERDPAIARKAADKCRVFMQDAKAAAKAFSEVIPSERTLQVVALLEQAE